MLNKKNESALVIEMNYSRNNRTNGNAIFNIFINYSLLQTDSFLRNSTTVIIRAIELKTRWWGITQSCNENARKAYEPVIKAKVFFIRKNKAGGSLDKNDGEKINWEYCQLLKTGPLYNAIPGIWLA